MHNDVQVVFTVVIKFYSNVASCYKTSAIVLVTAYALSACGTEGVPGDEAEQAPEIGAASESSLPESNTDNSDEDSSVGVSLVGMTNTSEPDQAAALPVESSATESIDVDVSAIPVPEAAVPEAAAPETVVPETAVPESSVPDVSVVSPPATEPVNFAPVIEDTSYNCDPVTESVLFSVGATDTFTLSVADEFPLSLRYSVDSSSNETVDVTVDDNGVFTITALAAGTSYVWLAVSDSDGLVDEYELDVIVE